MHVVLPEVDGRLSGGVGSFKQPSRRDPDLEFSRFAHQGDPERIKALVGRLAAHVALQTKPYNQRTTALVLSTYPGKEWNMAHAVGLDALASAQALLADILADGHAISDVDNLTNRLKSNYLHWDVEAYMSALASLPVTLTKTLFDVWGPPEDDPAFNGGHFAFRALRCGSAIVALQPERGSVATRDADYTIQPAHPAIPMWPYLWLKKHVMWTH